MWRTSGGTGFIPERIKHSVSHPNSFLSFLLLEEESRRGTKFGIPLLDITPSSSSFLVQSSTLHHIWCDSKAFVFGRILSSKLHSFSPRGWWSLVSPCLYWTMQWKDVKSFISTSVGAWHEFTVSHHSLGSECAINKFLISSYFWLNSLLSRRNPHLNLPPRHADRFNIDFLWETAADSFLKVNRELFSKWCVTWMTL